MTQNTPIKLAAQHGYDVTGVKGGGSDNAAYTLKKGDRSVVLDQTIVDEITADALPVKNPDDNSRIKAVGA